MPAAASSLPAGDEPSPRSDQEIEARTRAGFSLAAAAAVKALASAEPGPDPRKRDSLPAWPAPPPTPNRFGATTGTEPGDVAAARSAGWLVVACAHPRPSGEGPLSGVRLAVKDVIDVAGIPTQNGTPGGAWRDPTSSATAWQRLADAGALLVGKAATHEMAWGVTCPGLPNPVSPDRVTGGSSGGSAAAVAGGVAAAALGTDTGGSVRIPAALCGVVGIRPTLGSVPTDGVTALAPSQDVVGVLAHDVTTTGAVLEILQGRALAGVGPAGLRVGVPESMGALDPTVERSWLRALEALRGAGVDLVPVPDAPLRRAGAVSLLTMLIESADQHRAEVRADPSGFGGEARALLTLGAGLREHRDAVASARTALRDSTAAIFARHDLAAIATPTTACVAPHRDAETVVLDGRTVPVAVALTRFTGWASATGLPAISVPGPSDGLPVGIQLMAAPEAEAVCLALAAVLEG
jgi:aspartyl-tRNA(Asn)/glutamyl-tRNA(Gln) amidotransferase subunit A